MRNGNLKLATIAWCMVFGAYSEPLHWTKTPTGDNAEMAKQDFRNRLLSKTCFTQEQWGIYHQELVDDFRSKYVVHFDINKKFNSPIPNFEPALQVAYAYNQWVRELLKGVVWRVHDTLSPHLYEYCRTEAITVMNSYRMGQREAETAL
jgi:hypothetical protein